MSDVPARVRAEIKERSDHRCELISLSRGRCAGWGRDMHHVKFRSRGGKHTTDNLLHLCGNCHSHIHRETRPFYEGPFTDRKGRTYYSVDVGDSSRVRKDRMYAFEDIAEDMRDRAAHLDLTFQRAYQAETTARIHMARTLAEMDRFALFPMVNGEPEDANEYCALMGINSPSTVRSFLAAGTFLIDNPEEFERITAYNQECETGCEFTYSMLRDAVGSLRRKDAHERAVAITDMMNMRSAGMAGSECVDAYRLSRKGRTFEVTATFKATDRALTAQVAAADADLAKQAFRRLTGCTGALNGILEVESFRKVREV